MQQPELTPASAAPVDTGDRFAAYRTTHPGAKFIGFRDQRTGHQFVMAIPPSSPWHPLIDDQVVDIHPKEVAGT